jgi:hypothetical protein
MRHVTTGVRTPDGPSSARYRKSAAKSSIIKQSETKRDGRVGTKHELMIGVQTLWLWRKNREHPPAAPPSH